MEDTNTVTPMRTLGQLYQLLVDQFDHRMTSYWGICSLIGDCYYNDIITREEYFLVDNHFDTQKPEITSKFWWHPAYNRFAPDAWWWSKNNSGKNQRKKFLIHLAKKFK